MDCLFQLYIDNFEYAHNDDSLLVELNKNYSDFVEQLKNNIEQQTPHISLLLGQSGKGKKSCVRYAIHQLQE